MNIAVVGTGYVGLVTGTCFSETGNNVICVDVDKNKVQKLSNGELTIYEPELDKLFERNLRQGRLSFTSELKDTIDKSDIIFLALPTPSDEDGSADLSYVLGVANELGKIITSYKIIITKSTVPVGTAEMVRKAINENCKTEFDVVSNPEFLREGVAVQDFMKPDRVVIGTSSEKAKSILQDLYAPFVRQGNPIIFMDERSSEMTKYAANSFLATKISFMNEMANLCEIVGADVDAVRKGIGTDPRIGKQFLYPGIGFGGSCFPKDVQALMKLSIDNEYDFKILDSVLKINEVQRIKIVEKVKSYYDDSIAGKKFALWGLAFKPNTDDIREAPALYIIDELIKLGASICAYDPEAMNNIKQTIGDKIEYATNQYDALKDADALIIATEWSVFRTPDFNKISDLLKEKVIFDGRNLYKPESIEKLGYYYASIGRQTVNVLEKTLTDLN
ncbi:MAG: UDP-glucose/GDP-mannose dehydrogenase family protein [Bacteroidia bacterium]|nr:UDP-glucose/GDP-mannose dehydrogenase family protein [Bacteroidia bacterium]